MKHEIQNNNNNRTVTVKKKWKSKKKKRTVKKKWVQTTLNLLHPKYPLKRNHLHFANQQYLPA